MPRLVWIVLAHFVRGTMGGWTNITTILNSDVCNLESLAYLVVYGLDDSPPSSEAECRQNSSSHAQALNFTFQREADVQPLKDYDQLRFDCVLTDDFDML